MIINIAAVKYQTSISNILISAISEAMKDCNPIGGVRVPRVIPPKRGSPASLWPFKASPDAAGAGSDIASGEIRFTFGFSTLQDGISLVALALGLFGLSDILRSKDSTDVEAGFASTRQITRRNVRPNKEEVKRSVGPIARGSIIGSFLGILPGAGGTMSSFMSYATELRMSKKPERFGKGAIEGVSGPEAANSSAAITAFIPTLTLGIPGDSVMAIMLGAMMIHNIELVRYRYRYGHWCFWIYYYQARISTSLCPVSICARPNDGREIPPNNCPIWR